MADLTFELETIASLLELAARAIRMHGADRIDSAAWRVADASGLLRREIERAGIASQGVTTPTGRGCLLARLSQP